MDVFEKEKDFLISPNAHGFEELICIIAPSWALSTPSIAVEGSATTTTGGYEIHCRKSIRRRESAAYQPSTGPTLP